MTNWMRAICDDCEADVMADESGIGEDGRAQAGYCQARPTEETAEEPGKDSCLDECPRCHQLIVTGNACDICHKELLENESQEILNRPTKYIQLDFKIASVKELRGLLEEVLDWSESEGVKGCFFYAAVHNVGLCSKEEAAAVDDMWNRVRTAVGREVKDV
jgi:NifB/MoaA-like Fe-S oxidoreductase